MNACEIMGKCVTECGDFGGVCRFSGQILGQMSYETSLRLFENSALFRGKIPTLRQPHLKIQGKQGEGKHTIVVSCRLLTNRCDVHEEEEEEGCGSVVAVKYLKRHVLANPNKFKRAVASLTKEARFLSAFDHPNIVKLRGAAMGIVPKKEGSSCCGFFVATELVQRTLQKLILRWRVRGRRRRTRLQQNYYFGDDDEEEEAKKWDFVDRLRVALDIASAMEYLHLRQIVYRDLNPYSIGICSKDRTAKLIDFGLAEELKPDQEATSAGRYTLTDETETWRYSLTREKETWRYMAPEVARSEPSGLPSDVYSFGILLWELCTVAKPFRGYDKERYVELVVDGKERPNIDSARYPEFADSDLCDLMKDCWSDLPKNRPTFGVIHKTLEKIVKNASLLVPSSGKLGSLVSRSSFYSILSSLNCFGSANPRTAAVGANGYEPQEDNGTSTTVTDSESFEDDWEFGDEAISPNSQRTISSDMIGTTYPIGCVATAAAKQASVENRTSVLNQGSVAPGVPKLQATMAKNAPWKQEVFRHVGGEDKTF